MSDEDVLRLIWIEEQERGRDSDYHGQIPADDSIAMRALVRARAEGEKVGRIDALARLRDWMGLPTMTVARVCEAIDTMLEKLRSEPGQAQGISAASRIARVAPPAVPPAPAAAVFVSDNAHAEWPFAPTAAKLECRAVHADRRLVIQCAFPDGHSGPHSFDHVAVKRALEWLHDGPSAQSTPPTSGGESS